MDYLSRDSAPFSEEFWQKITEAALESTRSHLVGRKFLTIYGPLGSGASCVVCDRGPVSEESKDGVVKTAGRSFAELPQIYQDFMISWRDMEASGQTGAPMDMSPVWAAAHGLANKEDRLIFYGNEFTGTEGLMNVSGAAKMKLSDWKTGENAFTDVVTGIMSLQQKGITGRYVLCVSPAVYIELQRIQPGTGMLEKDRIASQLFGLFAVPVLKGRQAVLLSAEPQYADLAVGIDMAVAYLELKDLNHNCRILETVMPRIKRPEAIVVYE